MYIVFLTLCKDVFVFCLFRFLYFAVVNSKQGRKVTPWVDYIVLVDNTNPIMYNYPTQHVIYIA